MKVQIQTSPIHGQGLFAAEAILPGLIIISVFSKKGDKIYLDERARKLNHSDTPNAKAALTENGNALLLSQQPIAKGEEITVSYTDWNNSMPPEYRTEDFRSTEEIQKNAHLGIKTNNAEAEKIKYHTHKADYDFYAQGIPFSGIQEQSAKNLLGGQWKKIMIAAIGEKKFNEKAERYGNRPIDIKIAAVHTDKSKWFNPGETVQIEAARGNKNYDGMMKVVYKGPSFVALAKEYEGDAAGIIYNMSRLNGAKKSLDKFSGFAPGELVTAEDAKKLAEKLEKSQKGKDFKPVADYIKKDGAHTTGKWLFAISAAALALYGIYYFSKQKTE